jgi:hypothetical protein
MLSIEKIRHTVKYKYVIEQKERILHGHQFDVIRRIKLKMWLLG